MLMKNFTLLSVVALLATTSVFASVNPKALRPLDRMRGGDRTELSTRAHRQTARRLPAKASAVRHTPADAIVTPPAGTLHENMIVSFEGLAYTMFGFNDASTSAGSINLVEAADGSLYIQNLTPNLFDDELYWIKAEKVDDNGNYVIHKQPAGYYANSNIVDYISRLEYIEDEEGGFYYEALNTDIPMTWKDGVLSTPAQVNDDHPFGIVYANDEDPTVFDWEGETYYNFRAEELTETYVQPSADAKVENYVVYYTQAGTERATGVKVVFSDDKVYLKLNENVPGWVVGARNGDKITVQGGQYMGIDATSGQHNFMHISVTEVVLQKDEDYDDYYYDDFKEILSEDILTYDSDKGTITSTHTITIDASRNGISTSDIFVQPVFAPFDEVAAVPADPQIPFFYNYDEGYEYGEAYIYVPTTDINGKYINPEKLSFVVYFDDLEEPFEFETDEYFIEQNMTEIPALFSNGYDIDDYANMKMVTFYFEVSKFFGVQFIYRGAGEEHRSNIVIYDVETEETSTVEYGEEQSVTSVSAKKVSAQDCFDITGRRVSANAKGLILKSQTFADGSTKTVKVVRK